MKPVKKTAEVLAYKVLGRTTDTIWVEWAIEMLVAGFETEHLKILAGETKPFNQFEMRDLTSRVLSELHLDYSDKDKILKTTLVIYLINHLREILMA